MNTKETLLEIINVLIDVLDSNIVYYVIVPLCVVILGWIKSAYDIKCKNKELGYWFKKYRKLETFVVIVLRIYKKLAIISMLAMLSREIAIIFIDKTITHIAIGILCVMTCLVVLNIEWKKKNMQVEFLTDGKSKKILLGCLVLIFLMPYFITVIEGKYGSVFVLLWLMMLIVWLIFLFRCGDVGLILDNRYADIYIKDNEKAEQAAAGTIKKQGDWIIVRRYIHEYEEEIRIKEEDIVRIDYYGEPIIFIRKFGKRRR